MSPALQVDSLLLSHWGSPITTLVRVKFVFFFFFTLLHFSFDLHFFNDVGHLIIQLITNCISSLEKCLSKFFWSDFEKDYIFKALLGLQQN